MESRVNRYAINIVWSDNDGGYIATCLAFPGLSAFGETPEAAISEARIAIELFIKTYEEDGLSIPEPETVQEYSGQFRLRIPKSLHAQLARMAAAEEVSLNQFVLETLAERVGGQKVHEQTMKELRRAISELVVQHNFPLQSVNWPEPRITEVLEIKQVITTEMKSGKTASNKGKLERDN